MELGLCSCINLFFRFFVKVSRAGMCFCGSREKEGYVNRWAGLDNFWDGFCLVLRLCIVGREGRVLAFYSSYFLGRVVVVDIWGGISTSEA